jgi:hypothetical protein
MASIKDRIRGEPDIFLRLAQNSMVVAASIRENFVDNTLDLAGEIRGRLENNGFDGLTIGRFPKISGSEARRITASFIDGGVGEAEIFFRVPLIVRGGIFRIKEGERDLEKRETFEFFPVLIGDLEGGEKYRQDYSSVVRIIIELCSVIRVLDDNRYSDVSLIMLHGPLLYRLSAYTDHWFFEKDVDCMTQGVGQIVEQFREDCRECSIYRDWCKVWRDEKRIRANCLISFLLNKAIKGSIDRRVDLVGVVERASATEVSKVILEKMLHLTPDVSLKFLGRVVENYRDDAYRIARSANFTDPLIFSLVLNAGEYTSFYNAEERYGGFSSDLKGFKQKLPRISYTHLKPVDNAMAVRVEFPLVLSEDARVKALSKAYEYSRLLPNYAFPIGLDIADKFAKVPGWLVEAYRRYIMYNFGRLALDKELNEGELRKILMFYYLHQRDSGLRPKL